MGEGLFPFKGTSLPLKGRLLKVPWGKEDPFPGRASYLELEAWRGPLILTGLKIGSLGEELIPGLVGEARGRGLFTRREGGFFGRARIIIPLVEFFGPNLAD